MSTKTIKITYWILTSIFVLAMLADSIGGLTQQKAGQDALKHLGFPMYFLIISGIAKLLGALSILQTKFTTIKEWAYSGFVCTFIGAAMSHYFVGDTIGMTIAPLIIMAFAMLTYYFWKKYQTVQSIL